MRGLAVKWGARFRAITIEEFPASLACWGDAIAAGCASGKIMILNRITGSQVATLSGHSGMVISFAFSSDGTSLVSGSIDKTIKLWDMQTGGVVKTFCGHTNQVNYVSISADCTTIGSQCQNAIHLWNIQTGECYCTIGQQDRVKYIIFSPMDPRHIIPIPGDNPWQWNIDGHQFDPEYNHYRIVFSPNGAWFVSYEQGTFMLQTSDSGEIVARFNVTNWFYGDPSCFCFSPNSKLIAIGDKNITKVWDITGSDPHLVETFVGHTSIIIALAFSSSSSIVSSSNDGSVGFWQISVQSTDPVITNSKSTPLASVQIKSITLQANDGITISLDGVVRTWNISTGHCKTSFQTPAKDTYWSDVRLIDGLLILVWVKGQKIHIWDVEEGKPIQTIDAEQPTSTVDKGWGVKDLRISGDGSKVFCMYPCTIQAWSIWTGEAVIGVNYDFYNLQKSLIVDGSRLWAHSNVFVKGWDFGVAGPLPVEVQDWPTIQINDTKVWDINLSGVRDTVSGDTFFQLGGRLAQPADVQLDGWYLAVRYPFGEMLILDFNHMFPQ